ncbi:hypothetical protein [Piscinibacter sp.]|uniref:hypothetical protein n=1 Tax=Piscinibacter sp. TaxID=1903157 RepID=UPI0039E6D337
MAATPASKKKATPGGAAGKQLRKGKGTPARTTVPRAEQRQYLQDLAARLEAGRRTDQADPQILRSIAASLPHDDKRPRGRPPIHNHHDLALCYYAQHWGRGLSAEQSRFVVADTHSCSAETVKAAVKSCGPTARSFFTAMGISPARHRGSKSESS